MLCREICKKCYLENDDTDLCWSDETEREWKIKRMIDCIKLYMVNDLRHGQDWWLDVDDDEPPSECPYQLEHMTLSQNKEKFMRYEVVNPSDPYTLEWENFKIACVVTLIVGNGRYALEPLKDGGQKMPIFLMGGAVEWFKEEFGEELDDVIDNEKRDIVDCLRSIVIGSSADRDIYNETMRQFIEDSDWGVEESEAQTKWRKMWHDKKLSSMNDIGGRAWEIADKLESKIEKSE